MRTYSQNKKKNSLENAESAILIVIEDIDEIITGLNIREDEKWDIENGLKYARDILKEIRRELE